MPTTFDVHKDLATSTISTVPSPVKTGRTLTLGTGGGARMPSAPFDATICPVNEEPTPGNSEIVRVNEITGNAILDMDRAQYGTSARSVVKGDRIFAGITVAVITAIEEAVQNLELAIGSGSAPAITNPGPQVASVGVPSEVQIIASNANPYGAFSAAGLPEGMQINKDSGRIYGTPSKAETPSSTISVVGPGGTSSMTFAWAIAAAPAPVITKPADQTAVVGAPISLQVVATNATTYSIVGASLPKGLSINSSTGRITGTLTTVETPETTVKVDGPGGSKEAKWKWTISAAPAEGLAVRTAEPDPEAESTAATHVACSPCAGSLATDLLLMLVKLQHATVLQTMETPAGWTLIGTRGTITGTGEFDSFYVFARIWEGAAMPTLKASASVSWTSRMLSIPNGVDVNVSVGFTDAAAATEIKVGSVTTTVNGELVLAFLTNTLGASMTTPAGWALAGPYKAKNTLRPIVKTQAVAGATGATTSVFGGGSGAGKAPTTVMTLAVKPAVASATITEKLIGPENKAVKPEALPAGTTYIAVARCTAESGQDENTLPETVPAATTSIEGTVSHPWVAICALNASYEPIGVYTARLKTTPVAATPVCTKPPDQSSNMGGSANLQILATESPTGYTLTGAPTGLSISAGGLITGTFTKEGTYTAKVTATNATGTSTAVEWAWVVGPAASTGLITGLVLNSDDESAPTLAGIALGPASYVRAENGIGTGPSTLAANAAFYQAHSTTLLALAGHQSTLPTSAQVKALKGWAEALAPYGVKWIELGNETNYQIANNTANGKTYGERVKEACEAIAGTGLKLLVQGSDAGSGKPEWLDGIFTAWPGIAAHAAFGGWTIHCYPGSHVYGEADSWGKPMMERLAKRLDEHGDTTSGIYVTEWGAPCTSNGATMTSGQSLDWSEAAKLLEAHIPILEVASKHRMKMILLYQAHDQHPEGETDRERYFGALTSSGGAKGAMTTFARALL